MTGPAPFAIILGFPRSGTTLLSCLLNHHPEISCPPEPYVTMACARFIAEDQADGLAVGVLSALGFAGIAEDEVLKLLRELTLSLHRRMGDGKPVMVEKGGFNIFYLDAVERIFGRHAKFICVRRNPLDAILSMKELTDGIGIFLGELRPYLQANPSPLGAFADAWADREAALSAFIARNRETVVEYRYEDLLEKPEETLARITAFLGVAALNPGEIGAALRGKLPIGFGDWKIHQKTNIDNQSAGRWKSGLSKAQLARVLPGLAEPMLRHGYDVPRLPKTPDRATALRQFQAMTGLRRSALKAPQ